MQRYIYVCHAPVAKQVMIYLKYIIYITVPQFVLIVDPCVCSAQWCTVSRSWLFVCLILVTAMVAMSPRVLDRNYDVTTTGTEKYNMSSLVSTYHIKI